MKKRQTTTKNCYRGEVPPEVKATMFLKNCPYLSHRNTKNMELASVQRILYPTPLSGVDDDCQKSQGKTTDRGKFCTIQSVFLPDVIQHVKPIFPPHATLQIANPAAANKKRFRAKLLVFMLLSSVKGKKIMSYRDKCRVWSNLAHRKGKKEG